MNPLSKFFVLCQFSTGRAWVERDDGRADWTSLIEDIASGQITDVVEVREAGTWRDCTEEAARAVATEWANNEEPLSHQNYIWLELVLGTRVARNFMRAA